MINTSYSIRPDFAPMHAYPVSDATGMVKLDVMENPYRLPEWLAAEIGEIAAKVALNRYPVPTSQALRERVRAVAQVPRSFEVLLGTGSDECIQYITAACAKPDAVVLAPAPSFVMYAMQAQFYRCKFVGVALNADFTLNLPATLEAIQRERPTLTWIAYPNNPTGNIFSGRDVEAIIRAAAPGLVVIDEAYQPFARASFMGRLGEFDNLCVMRTFSKVGLAGLRLGYVAGAPAWIGEFDKARSPFNTSVITQALADKLLQHMDVFEAQCRSISVEREIVERALQAMPSVTAFPSAANFILARVPNSKATFDKMIASKVLVKNFGGGHPLLSNCLRLTIGTPDENRAMIAALSAAL